MATQRLVRAAWSGFSHAHKSLLPQLEACHTTCCSTSGQGAWTIGRCVEQHAAPLLRRGGGGGVAAAQGSMVGRGGGHSAAFSSWTARGFASSPLHNSQHVPKKKFRAPGSAAELGMYGVRWEDRWREADGADSLEHRRIYTFVYLNSLITTFAIYVNNHPTLMTIHFIPPSF